MTIQYITAPTTNSNQTALAAMSLTMSSLEIAELTDKEHKNVLADIRKMLISLGNQPAEFSARYIDAKGEGRECFSMPKRECLILVSGYSVELRARIIDRWMELEAKEAAQPPAPPRLNDPSWLRATLLGYTEKVIRLEGEVEEMRPQVQALDRIANSEGSLCITDAAKTLQVQPKALFMFLRSHRWIYTRAGCAQEIAFQDKLASGLLEHKTTTVHRSDGSEKTVTQVRVTPKGLTRLAREFQPVAKVA